MIRVATITSTVIAGSALMLLAGCEFGPKKIEQTGYRGTGGAQITAVNRVLPQEVPAPPYDLPPDGGPLAKETYQNVKVLGNVSTERFNHLMAAITQWVAPPEAGCNYCHNPNNMASDEVYTKVVARKMLQMTIKINSQWVPHFGGAENAGVTCYTCHRGNAVPKNVWAMADAPGGSTRTMSNRHGQGKPIDTVAYASLPYDPFTPYLAAKNNIRVQGTTRLPGDKLGASIVHTEKNYALMMHMSSSLNVNCTFCHNTDAFSSWSSSRPQRVTAWYGIRMVRDLNNNYITALGDVWPANRRGPHGDPLKVNCSTCHQGLNKPLGGKTMLQDYPALRGTPVTPAVVPAVPEAVPTAAPVAMAPGKPTSLKVGVPSATQ